MSAELVSPILQMADGRFYDPSSGKIADSREALMDLLTATTTPSVAPTSTIPVPPATSSPVSSAFPLRSAIQRGQELLAERFGPATSSVARLVQKPSWLGVTLAVWNQQTDDISFLDLQVKGNAIKTNDEGAVVSLKFSNGVNSQFIFPHQPEKIVVALRYPIITSSVGSVTKTVCRTKTSCRKKTVSVTTYRMQNVIYTPYSPALQTPQMVAWGQQVFFAYVDHAFSSLRADGIRSRAFPDRFVADVVDPELVRGIVAIEHLDTNVVKNGPDTALGSFFVMLGANEDRAYAYARSSAKALGLAQFIPSTYQRLQKRMDLKLNPSFEEGMRDPDNAVRAEIAYLDEVLAELPSEIRQTYDADHSRVNEYLAAAYNGGTSRVKKAIATWGDAWAESQTAKVAALHLQKQKLKSSITLTKRKVAKGGDQKAIQKLRADLSNLQEKLTMLTVDITHKQNASLKKETVFYVQKYRALADALHPRLALSSPPF